MELDRHKSISLSLFDYLDYREYLRDFYNFQKNKNSRFSYRAFAIKANLSSPNYLKLVIDGTRRITDKSLPSFIRGLRLNLDEAKYFRLIVRFNETSEPQEKRELLSKIVTTRNRKVSKAFRIDKNQERILKHWSHWVILEMVLLDNFQCNANWISKTLKFKVTPKQVQESLDLLLKTGMIEVKDGKYIQSNPRISTDDEIANLLLRNLHAQMIDLGLNSLFKDEVNEREFAGLTISLAEDQIPKFKEKIKRFRQDLNAEFSNQEGKRSKVYHMEIMFFPVSKEGREC